MAKYIHVKVKKEINQNVKIILSNPEIQGKRFYNKFGRLHRIDGPAVIGPNGLEQWFFNGKPHRLDGPAIVWPDGSRLTWFKVGYDRNPLLDYFDHFNACGRKEWWVNGKKHRDFGPSVEWGNGSKEWYQHGERHRERGPAVEGPDGFQSWIKNGKLHREDGPAVIRVDGTKEWYWHGKRHREPHEGPAIEDPSGRDKWWQNGEYLIELEGLIKEEFDRLVEIRKEARKRKEETLLNRFKKFCERVLKCLKKKK